MIDGEDLAGDDHAVHIEIQVLHLYDLAAERSTEDHIARGRLRGGSGRGRLFCRFFDLHGRRLRHCLAADSCRLVKERSAL